MQNFSDRVNSAWRRSKIRKGEIARRLGVDPTTVSRWFAGQIPEAQTLSRFAALLGTTADGLLGSGAEAENRRSDQISAPLEPAAMLHDEGKPGGKFTEAVAQQMLDQLVDSLPSADLMKALSALMDDAEKGNVTSLKATRYVIDRLQKKRKDP